MTTSAEQNKALVLEAFETLFNRRDYDAAQRFWSPDYIQHSPAFRPGREGLFELVKARRVAEACGLAPWPPPCDRQDRGEAMKSIALGDVTVS